MIKNSKRNYRFPILPCATTTIPKQIRTQGNRSTLIGLFEKFSGACHTILPQRITILVAEHVQYFQARANYKRDGIEFIRGYVVIVQGYGLAKEKNII